MHLNDNVKFSFKVINIYNTQENLPHNYLIYDEKF